MKLLLPNIKKVSNNNIKLLRTNIKKIEGKAKILKKVIIKIFTKIKYIFTS